MATWSHLETTLGAMTGLPTNAVEEQAAADLLLGPVGRDVHAGKDAWPAGTGQLAISCFYRGK